MLDSFFPNSLLFRVLRTRFAFFPALLAALAGFTPGADAKIDFESEVLPLLEKSCVGCHRAPYEENGRLKKPKAGLRLDAAWAILAGGENGKVLAPGDAENSELYWRTTLPEDDSDFMPPKGEKWTEKDKKVVHAWIQEGADFGAWEGNLEGKPAKVEAEEALVSRVQLHYETLAQGLSPATEEQLARVREAGGRVMPIAKDNPLLEVDFLVNRDQVTDETLASLEAIREQLVHLDLSRTGVTGAGLSHLKGMPRLTRLNLHSTQVNDQGLVQLQSLSNLSYLNLYNTPVTDQGLLHLASLDNLRSLYLWQSKVTPAGIRKLQRKLPDTFISWQ
jgi:hypothetical protein